MFSIVKKPTWTYSHGDGYQIDITETTDPDTKEPYLEAYLYEETEGFKSFVCGAKVSKIASDNEVITATAHMLKELDERWRQYLQRYMQHKRLMILRNNSYDPGNEDLPIVTEQVGYDDGEKQ